MDKIQIFKGNGLNYLMTGMPNILINKKALKNTNNDGYLEHNVLS